MAYAILWEGNDSCVAMPLVDMAKTYIPDSWYRSCDSGFHSVINGEALEAWPENKTFPKDRKRAEQILEPDLVFRAAHAQQLAVESCLANGNNWGWGMVRDRSKEYLGE